MRFVVGIIALLFATDAQAKHRHHHKPHYRYWVAQSGPKWWPENQVRAPAASRRSWVQIPPHVSAERVAHPAGCPHTQFCGCGVSVRVYGHSVHSLWLAANWRRFPPTTPQPGAVAVFGWHHVAYIERMITSVIALVFDPNSGHHETRIHPRSIANAMIVRPL